MVYRCKSCAENGGAKLQAVVKSLSSLVEDEKKLKNNIVPAIQNDIQDLKVLNNNLASKIDKYSFGRNAKFNF